MRTKFTLLSNKIKIRQKGSFCYDCICRRGSDGSTKSTEFNRIREKPQLDLIIGIFNLESIKCTFNITISY